MLTSLALLFLCGMTAARIAHHLRLPGLCGMLLTGMLLGPHGCNLLAPDLLKMAPDLRQIALIIILTRVGLALDLNDLRRVGRPAVLMCFLPALLEITGVLLLAPPLLGISLPEAAVAGAVLAAVSPAVIVPRMLRLIQEGYGARHSVPQLLMAGSSMDDVLVIVLFSAAVTLTTGGTVTPGTFGRVPIAIGCGILGGAVAGWGLERWFRRFPMHGVPGVLLLLSTAFLLTAFESKAPFPFSGLLAVMTVGIVLLRGNPVIAERFSAQFAKLWIPAEILLFALVGATVDLQLVLQTGPWIVAVVAGALLFRVAGVYGSLLKSALTRQERSFCMLAYLPKATVQAAIGAVPLSLNLPCGRLVLAMAVVSIVLTAPAGAWAIDFFAPRLLKRDGTAPSNHANSFAE